MTRTDSTEDATGTRLQVLSTEVRMGHCGRPSFTESLGVRTDSMACDTHTQRQTYHHDHFYVYGSVVLSIFTLLSHHLKMLLLRLKKPFEGAETLYGSMVLRPDYTLELPGGAFKSPNAQDAPQKH